jgi:hypothetical protein
MIARQHFSSSTDFANWCKINLDGTKSSWSANGKMQAGIKSLEFGNTNYVEEIKKVSTLIWENIPVLRRIWQTSVYGVFPNVPAYLRGEPEHMFNQQDDYNEHTPIKLYIGVGSSAGISNNNLIKRGAALAAFASALSEIRPVTLTPYSYASNRSYTESSVTSWDISSSPLILSDIAACLIDENVHRGVCVEADFTINKTFPGYFEDNKDEEKMRRYLGCQEQDLFFPQVYLTDPWIQDPIKMVKEYLSKYTTEGDNDSTF